MKFSDVFEFKNKSGIKAGDGLEQGRYFFYTSSDEQTKFLNEYLFDGDALIFGTGGNASVHFTDNKFAVSTDCLVAQPIDKKKAHAKFYYYFLRGNMRILERGFKGAGLKHISKSYISAIELPKEDFDRQKTIVEILDQADALRQKRKQSLQLLDDFLRATFLDMFGDLYVNSKNWPKKNLRDICERFSDGPFGSNLKTEHYKESGVRIVRLQNIGLGEFLDQDKAYISESHYKTIKKHTCLPGDILIATMGNPNIRACILPRQIAVAVNKADCVQCRPQCKIIMAEFLCHFFNSSSALAFISNFLHGQTRTRVSMGQLSKIDIPVPPLELQKRFSELVDLISHTKEFLFKSTNELDNQFNALTQRYFG